MDGYIIRYDYSGDGVTGVGLLAFYRKALIGSVNIGVYASRDALIQVIAGIVLAMAVHEIEPII